MGGYLSRMQWYAGKHTSYIQKQSKYIGKVAIKDGHIG
jgi:hypothetical protein